MSDIPSYYSADRLILGVGNPLFGDDGFGPAVVEELENRGRLPNGMLALDVGTGVREILFNLLLSDERPKRIIIIDALDCGRSPGDVFKVSIEEIPAIKKHDFSLHLAPSLNLLKELKESGRVGVEIIACQPESIPEIVRSGLSAPVRKAVQETADYLLT